jgi:uncharacterized membrane protein YeaQ/YmgE (transglycosylase-associated protein family)
MPTLLVFALIGLLAGAAARVLYPRRQPTHILATMLLGAAGGLAGGMFSWLYWQPGEGLFHPGNVLLALLGAGVVIAFAAGVGLARRLNGYRDPSP